MIQRLPPPVNGDIARVGSGNLITELSVILDEQNYAFDRSMVRSLLLAGSDRLQSYSKDNHDSECIIAGNGPSLDNTDWDQIDGKVVFASNYALLNPELAKRATFLTAVNPWVVAQNPGQFEWDGVTTVLPFYQSAWVAESESRVLVDYNGSFDFARSFRMPFSVRSTVSYFALQLAYVLGFRHIRLIGFDHTYVQPADAVEGDLLKSEAGDPNHFSSEYFRGKVWQAADVDSMAYVYALSDYWFRRAGGEIVNSSTASKLSLFRKIDLDKELLRGSSLRKPSLSTRLTVWSKLIAAPRSVLFLVLVFLAMLAQQPGIVDLVSRLTGGFLNSWVIAAGGLVLVVVALIALYSSIALEFEAHFHAAKALLMRSRGED